MQWLKDRGVSSSDHGNNYYAVSEQICSCLKFAQDSCRRGGAGGLVGNKTICVKARKSNNLCQAPGDLSSVKSTEKNFYSLPSSGNHVSSEFKGKYMLSLVVFSFFPISLTLQSLPQHYHVYHVTENQSSAEELVQPSGMGLLLYRIGFTHPSHIPEIIPVRF